MEKLDDLFTYKERDETTYFVSEGPADQELDVGSSGGAAPHWRRMRFSLRDMNLKT